MSPIKNSFRNLLLRALPARKAVSPRKKHRVLGCRIDELEDRTTPALLGLEAADITVSATAGLDGGGDVAVMANGTGFVVAYESNDANGDGGIFFKRYDANWQLTQGPIAVNTFTTNRQFEPSVGLDASGNFVIAYSSFGQDPGDSAVQAGVYARRYTAAGTAIDGAEFRVNNPITTSQQRDPDVAVNAAGQFVVAFRDSSGGLGSGDIYAQSYASVTGGLTTVGTNVIVNDTSFVGSQSVPAVAIGTAGNYVVAYQSNGQDGDGFGIYARRMNQNGTTNGAEFLVNTGATINAQQFPDIAMDGAGNFTVVWYSELQVASFPFDVDIFQQRYNASAAPQGSNTRVNTFTTNTQVNPHISMNASGQTVVAWEGEEADSDTLGTDVFFQQYSGGGATPVGVETKVNQSVNDDISQGFGTPAIDGVGDFIVTFDSNAASLDSYLRRYGEAPVINYAAGTSNPSEGIGTANVGVTRTGAQYVLASVNSSVSVTRTGGTATPPGAGQDFTTAFPATVTFSAALGLSSQTVNQGVAIVDDAVFEGSESIQFGFAASPTNATLGATTPTHTLSIADNETAPSISIGNASLTEGDSGSANMTFTVTMSGQSAASTQVNYTTVNGTAIAGTDYTGTSGTLTFPALNTSQTFTVPVLGNTIFQANRQFTATLSGPTASATIGTGTGTATINDDDAPASIAVSSGNNQTTGVSSNFASPLVALVKNAAGNAVQGVSVVYTAPGSGASSVFSTTTNTITVTSNASGLASTGTFAANATAGVNYAVSAAATGGTNPSTNFTLTNTAPPVINVGNASLSEGDSGSTNMTFNVTLTSSSAATVTVNYATANGTAIAGTDYTATSGTVTFTPGQITQPINVPILGNTIFQANRQFTVVLSGPSGGGSTIGTGTGTGTITDNDAPTSIAVSSGNNQSTGTGSNFTNPLVALVKNANNNAVQGVSVVYTAPAAGASSVFSTTTNTITVTSNASGLASTGTFAANGTTGANYTVSAAATGGTNPSVNFTLTNVVSKTITSASFSADTGISSSDFITKTAAQTISGLVSANLIAGEFVEVSLDNGTTWANATTSVGNNTWTLTTTLVASDTLKVRVSNAGGSGPVFSQAYVLDTTAPNVTNVTATNANGAYKAGAAIVATIAFNESVIVTGSPVLALNSGGTATYASGSPSTTLSFNYGVLAGQNSPDLDYTSTSALGLAGGTIFDTAGNAATLTLAAPGAAGSLGANKNIIIDTAVPTATFISTPANPTNSASATFSFAGNDPGGSGVNHLETNIDGGAFAAATSPQTFLGLTEGNHTVRVQAVDNAGNVGAPTSFTWAIDLTNPTATISITPPNPTNSTGASFTFSGSDPVSGGVSSGINRLETSIDAGPFATATSPQSFSGLTEGNHTFQVRAVDNVGNVGTTSFNWVIDTTKPTASFISTPANPSNNTAPTFTFSGSDPTSGGVSSGVNHLEIKLDGGAFAAATSPQTLSGLTEGSHTFQVQAVDNAGNVGTAVSYSWNIDITGPTATILTNPPAATNSGAATFTFSGSDPTSGGVNSGVNHLETKLDGGVFALATSPQSFAGLAEGSHTFQVQAVDNAGNTGVPATYTWIVDTTLPTASFTGTPSNPSNNTGPTFSFTGNDPTSGGVSSGISRLETALDAGPYATASSPQSLSGLSEGNHTFHVRAVDVAGNTGAVVNFNWVIDTTAPTASFTVTPTNPSNNTGPTFSFTGNDPTSGGVSSGVNHLETKLDGGAFATMASPQTLSGLSEGSHTFQVRAVDNAGNTGGATSFIWTIDTTGPTATITGSPANPTNATTATFSFSGSDPTSGGVSSGVNHLETKLDGGSFALATSPQTFTGLAEGNHTFQVRAVDNAGNPGTPSTFTWMVDTTLPTASITGMPTNPSNVANPTFSFAGSDPTSSSVSSGVNRLETQIDGGGFTTATSPQTLSPLADGSHTFQVRAVDNAGNVGAATGYTWTIDTQAPAISLVTSSSANGVYGVGATINVTVNFSEPVTLAGGSLIVNLDTGGTVTLAPFSSQTSVSGTYTVAGGDNSADLNSTSLTLSGGATLRDAANNNATLTIPAGQSLADGKAIIVDTQGPAIGISAPTRLFTNNATAVSYTVTYTDVNLTAVTLTDTDILLNTTNGATANVTVAPTGSLDTWTVTLNNVLGNGLIGISIKKDTAIDAAGNKAPAAGPSATFEADNILPTVSIGAPSVTTTKAGPVIFNVTINDINLVTPVILTPAQVQVIGTPGTVTGDVAVSQTDATHFKVTVTNVRGGQGTLAIRLPAGLVADKAGNVNAGPVDSATFQVTGLRKLKLDIGTPPAVAKLGAQFTYLIAFSNRGTQRDDNVSIIVTLPEGATFNPAKSTAGWTSIGNGQFKLGVGNLAIGARSKVKFAVILPATLPSSGKATFTASITDDLALGVPLATRTVSSRFARSRYQ